MPKNFGTHLDKNPFAKAMKSNIPNASEIMQEITTALTDPTITDVRIIALRDYFTPFNKRMQIEAALQTADRIAKEGATKGIVTTVAGTKVALKSWIKAIANVYDEGTDEYNRLLIGGATTFYEGSRAKRLIRINALITAIDDDADLADVKASVQLFADAFTTKTATQKQGKKNVKTNSADIKALVADCTEAVWYVYLGLMMVFIKIPAKALAFLPMKFIYEAANQKSYTTLIPAHIRKKICRHLAKTGETYTMKNNRLVPIKIGLALTAKSDVLVWYNLLPGLPVTIDPSLLGNILYTYVMAQNDDLLISGDITFTINAAA